MENYEIIKKKLIFMLYASLIKKNSLDIKKKFKISKNLVIYF